MAISVLPQVKLNQRQKAVEAAEATITNANMLAAKANKRQKSEAFLVHMTISTLANYNMHTHVSSTRCAKCKMREFLFSANKNLNKITVVIADAQPTNNEI